MVKITLVAWRQRSYWSSCCYLYLLHQTAQLYFSTDHRIWLSLALQAGADAVPQMATSLYYYLFSFYESHSHWLLCFYKYTHLHKVFGGWLVTSDVINQFNCNWLRDSKKCEIKLNSNFWIYSSSQLLLLLTTLWQSFDFIKSCE